MAPSLSGATAVPSHRRGLFFHHRATEVAVPWGKRWSKVTKSSLSDTAGGEVGFPRGDAHMWSVHTRACMCDSVCVCV